MGNKDGIAVALSSQGQNRVEKFEGGWFSFAFGNEIALCLDGQYFILNCDKVLWEEVKNEIIKTNMNKKKLV